VKAAHWPGLLPVLLKVAHNDLRKMDRWSKRSLIHAHVRRTTRALQRTGAMRFSLWVTGFTALSALADVRCRRRSLSLIVRQHREPRPRGLSKPV